MGKSLQISNANNSSIEPVITISDIKNVGIGTTNPLHILDLGTSISSKKLALYNSNYNINGAAGFYGFGTGNGTLDFHANSAENTSPQMVLKNGGNVGIGTDNPISKLHVEGNIMLGSNSGDYRVIRPSTGSNTKLYLSSEASTYRSTSIDMGIDVISMNVANSVNQNIHNRFVGHKDYTSMCMSSEDGLSIYNGIMMYSTSFNISAPTTNAGAPTIRLNTHFNHTTIYSDTGTYIGLSGTSIYTNAATNSISDDRCKHNEEPIENALSTINKLNVKKYDKTKDILDSNFNGNLDDLGIENYKEIGMIAQDVKNISELKFCVSEYKDPITGENMYTLNYHNIHNISIKAIQELSQKNNTLETKNAELENKVSILETKNEQLESKYDDLQKQFNNIIDRLSKLENN